MRITLTAFIALTAVLSTSVEAAPPRDRPGAGRLGRFSRVRGGYGRHKTTTAPEAETTRFSLLIPTGLDGMIPTAGTGTGTVGTGTVIFGTATGTGMVTVTETPSATATVVTLPEQTATETVSHPVPSENAVDGEPGTATGNTTMTETAIVEITSTAVVTVTATAAPETVTVTARDGAQVRPITVPTEPIAPVATATVTVTIGGAAGATETVTATITDAACRTLAV